ncbi:uncharacterized protein [Haliaeetus albicilla]|uniref:uncharacterized protein n=1 Tax=Haliaeetus albicilla TaxID=8969 RepID=UPI0037E786AA
MAAAPRCMPGRMRTAAGSRVPPDPSCPPPPFPIPPLSPVEEPLTVSRSRTSATGPGPRAGGSRWGPPERGGVQPARKRETVAPPPCWPRPLCPASPPPPRPHALSPPLPRPIPAHHYRNHAPVPAHPGGNPAPEALPRSALTSAGPVAAGGGGSRYGPGREPGPAAAAPPGGPAVQPSSVAGAA